MGIDGNTVRFFVTIGQDWQGLVLLCEVACYEARDSFWNWELRNEDRELRIENRGSNGRGEQHAHPLRAIILPERQDLRRNWLAGKACRSLQCAATDSSVGTGQPAERLQSETDTHMEMALCYQG